ncbi:MAG TPA: TIR domain-containing protein [Candidatus Pacearchaeota archaeon]|nr:TIR domain-containing protein [Candidatus Pacearchaeota archaeon]
MKNLNLFISYSHLDEGDIDEFNKHISPLKENGLIETWHDRKILGGQEFQDSIDNNIENADVIILFISSNFLSSAACLKEKTKALDLKKKRCVVVIPVILSACGWLDDETISPSLALPTDGEPIDSYANTSDAWHNVYEGLKLSLNLEVKIQNVKVKDEFVSFLESTEMLTKAHSKKERVLLSDIFVYPSVKKYDDLREYEKDESSEKLIHKLLNYSKILIAGENQSGKTTLCKKIFLALRDDNYFPVYVADKSSLYLGKIDNKISSAFSEQYDGIDIDEISRKRVIPIIDDFHFAKHKDKIIETLTSYKHQVIIVDDIFCLNIRDESIIQSYTHFKIKELNPSLRDKLIQKWTHLTEYNENSKNDQYHNIDKTTELVNASLGKVIGSGIMPAYPFFILSVISTNEAFGKSLDQEITSQGYCYQALIYLYLRKEGVENEDIDTYINFLTECSFFFYKAKKEELSSIEFNSFIKQYSEKYNLPIKKETLLDKLQKTQIIIKDSFGNYCFSYPYLYYFFVAKYIAEHIDKNKKVVDEIINNLHKDENSYIAIFISHHSKSEYVLDEITLNACSLFENNTPATLSKSEIKFLDDQVDMVVQEVLPSTTDTPEKERANRLKIQDEEDQLKRNDKEEVNTDDDLTNEVRRSIKTVEVMGRIIKNRAGSLEKERLETIFEEAMKVHLRILTSFFDIVENDEDEVIEFISSRVRKIIEDKESQRRIAGKKINKPSNEDLKKLSKLLFCNMNFIFIYGLINKIIHSLGSDKLTEVIEKVCNNENTPASCIVKHGVLMWYNKNLQVNNIVKEIERDGFSETAKKILNFMIVNHCAMHSINFKDKQKIESKLNIPSQKLVSKSI